MNERRCRHETMQIVLAIFNRAAIAHEQHATACDECAQTLRQRFVHNLHHRQHHDFVARKILCRTDHVGHDIGRVKRRIQPHELLRKVKHIGLLLNRPRLNIVIVIQHGNIGMNRRTQTRLLRDVVHEFLHLAVFTTGFIVNIKDTEAKLFRAAIHTAPAEKQHIIATARHRLIRPELSLLRTR